MANIKKAFTAIASLLAANPDVLVSEIYPQAVELMSAKSGGGGSATSFHKDEEGNVVALHCSYHKKWFNVADVEFGVKASSASGFNTMSKDGMSKWTKQLAEFKKAQAQLLTDVSKGEVQASDIAAITEQHEEARASIVPMETQPGYDSLEELLAATAA